MSDLPFRIKKYLNKYSLPNWITEYNSDLLFNNIVVIPSICEFENISKLISSLVELENKYFSNTLFLFVVNNKKNISEEIKTDNIKSLNLLNGLITHQKDNINDKIFQSVISSGINIGVIDASSTGNELPDKDAGIGIARKIGMDCALKLFNYSTNNKKTLICLDADCTVSKNYLTEIADKFNYKNINAAVIRYEHNINKNDEETKAIIYYEILLRYYHLGLIYANSSYAFATIGSAMACDVESYIQIEGMNKRKAAEDFYFLEKLSKNIKVSEINNAIVFPSGRKSWRVPFGTGQSVSRYLSNSKGKYLLHNPKSFEILKKWNNLLLNEKNTDLILNKSKGITQQLYDYLEEQKFSSVIKNIASNAKTEKQLNSQKIKWFDGFKTLKLIHYLKDNGYPDINMFDALDEMLRMLNINIESKRVCGMIPELDIQKKYLFEMRNYIYR